MSQTYGLDSIIKKLSEAEEHPKDTDREKIVIWDAKNAKVIEKRPLWGTLFSDLHFFRISSRGSVNGEGPECKFHDLETDQSITLKIKYQVSCLVDDAKKTVAALQKGSHPEEALKEAMRGWITDYYQKNRADFLSEYYKTHKKGLVESLARDAKEMGLDLTVVPMLLNEEKIGMHEFATDYFSVTVRDCDEKLSLKVTAGLDVANKVLAILNFHGLERLREFVQDSIKTLIFKDFNLQDFYYHLHGKVRQGLIEALNPLLADQGRTVAFLNLERSGRSVPELTSRIHHRVEIRIKDCPEPIGLEHTLLIDLFSAGKLKSARVEDIQAWTRTRLQQITQSLLFERSYAQLLMGFEEGNGDAEGERLPEITLQIKDAMKEETEAIGYKIRHLVSLPDTLLFKLKDSFQFQTEGVYVTSNSRVKVKLSVFVSGRVRSLKDIEDYLNPKTDILDKMKGLVDQETTRVIHKIDPERFYMRFSFTDRTEETVKDLLAKEIRGKLKEKFKLEIAEDDVIPKIVDNELTTRFVKLQQAGPYRFQVQAIPLHAMGNKEPITFTIRFSVDGVWSEGWEKFQSRGFPTTEDEVQAMVSVLQDRIKGALDTLGADDLKYVDIKEKELLTRLVSGLSEDAVRKDFGLSVRVVEVRRDVSILESAQQAMLIKQVENIRDTYIHSQEKMNQSTLDALDILYTKKKGLLGAGVQQDDPEFANLEKGVEKTLGSLASSGFEVKKKTILALGRERGPNKNIKEVLRHSAGRKSDAGSANEQTGSADEKSGEETMNDQG